MSGMSCDPAPGSLEIPANCCGRDWYESRPRLDKKRDHRNEQ
jgi:hypothetical protein